MIIKIVAGGNKTGRNGGNPPYTYNNSNNNGVPQGQGSKYKPITSHYSQATLQGTAHNNNNVRTVSAKPSPMAGKFIPNGDQTSSA